MGVPSGKIVARPMVARACGCVCEFQHYAVDKYRAERLAKFQQTRCPECVAKIQEAERLAVAARPPKGEAVQSLPPGTVVTLVRQPDGNWAGTLAAAGTEVTALADALRPLPVTLAQMWAVARAGGT
ncbi:MAG TPA: hypothetical protein VGF55_29380 [Gemmataceae bacterium]|jgi:hypothetical protein